MYLQKKNVNRFQIIIIIWVEPVNHPLRIELLTKTTNKIGNISHIKINILGKSNKIFFYKNKTKHNQSVCP